MEIEPLKHWYKNNFQKKLKGRRICYVDIKPLLENLDDNFTIESIGVSEKGKEIQLVKFGTGKINILIWTQMHGNESTGTKAVFDLFKFFEKQNKSLIKDKILKNCTISVIPILNPDGAKAYTRVNANKIDLNRDAVKRISIESNILRSALDRIKPKYCFNMHDQRTIFSVGEQNNPATLSFLAPSVDKAGVVTKGRKETMKIIVSMFCFLNISLGGQIGRYTDEFYPTATGDNFQKLGHNTILIESGHFKDDYERIMSRKFTFFALLNGIHAISNEEQNINYNDYFLIPNNKENYLDLLIKKVKFKKTEVDVGVIYEEKLVSDKINLNPKIKHIGNLDAYNANTILEAPHLDFNSKSELKYWINNEFSNKIKV